MTKTTPKSRIDNRFCTLSIQSEPVLLRNNAQLYFQNSSYFITNFIVHETMDINLHLYVNMKYITFMQQLNNTAEETYLTEKVENKIFYVKTQRLMIDEQFR